MKYYAKVCVNEKCVFCYGKPFNDKWCLDYNFCPHCGSKLKKMERSVVTIHIPRPKKVKG
jgi:DNA-directed RNA polymerase subunit RPC12/RpoP